MLPEANTAPERSYSLGRPAKRSDDTVECLAVGAQANGLTEAQRLIQAIFLNSPAIISLKDRHGKYILVNGQFESLFHLSKGAAVGQTDFAFMPFVDAVGLRAHDDRTLATGQSLELEESVIRDGVERTYLTQKFPIAGPSGDWVAVCGISTDITARKQGQLHLEIQHAVTSALAESATLKAAGPRILQRLAKALDFNAGRLWEANANQPSMRVAATWQATEMPKALFAGMESRSTPSRNDDSIDHSGVHQVPVPSKNQNHLTSVTSKEGTRLQFSILGRERVIGAIELFSNAPRFPDEHLQTFLSGIGLQIGHFVEQSAAEQAWRDRQREFEIARTVQAGLIPCKSPFVEGFTIAGSSVPAQETGGDYFDYIPMSDGSLGVVVGDASGHGIGAALVIAQVRAYLRARAVTDTDITSILDHVNRQLAADLPPGHFVTLLFTKIDGPGRTITYASAGHWPGFIFSEHGEVLARLSSTGFPLGIDAEAVFPTATLPSLESNEFILFMTDGIVEAIDSNDLLFGEERTQAVARSVRHQSASAIVDAVLGAAQSFSGQSAVDDMTAVVVKADAIRSS